MDRRPIGVFDSGVGGLSILIELKKLLPHEDFVFLADQKYVPYGEKTKKELVALTSQITNYFINEHDIKMMVVACNTATCGAIDELRAKYYIPIVGTVPAIKPAAEKTKTKIIGVIATPSTSKSSVVSDLIKNNCKGIQVFNIGCKGLEDTVENGRLEESPAVKKLLTNYLKDIKESNADYLVLGCTHYPFLKKVISKMVGRPINLIDSGEAIARRTQSLIKRFSLANKQKSKGKTLYFTTGKALKFSSVATQLMKREVRAQKASIVHN